MVERKLKLLIVDDEAEIREGISRLIPWEENGVVVAGMAGNGREALRLIQTLGPDLVLLDIRMPVLDGFDVLEQLAGRSGLPKVIILSGYDDFEYCQRALRNGVIDYLLKPCRPQEVLAAVMKVKSQLDTARGAGFWEEPDALIHYPDPEAAKVPEDNMVFKEQQAIVQCIRTNDSEQLIPAVDAFFTKLLQQGSKGYVQKMVTALMCSIYHVCVERGIRTEKIFGPNLAVLDELSLSQTPDELRRQIYLCVNRIIDGHPVHDNQGKLVNQALKYMEEHYAEPLSLETVAQQVYVSAGYLSAIFKKVVQKNFVDCLHQVRVDQAKELLHNRRLKVYEVAVGVGYKDEKYFSQIFKKVTGMTPNQYRETIH